MRLTSIKQTQLSRYEPRSKRILGALIGAFLVSCINQMNNIIGALTKKNFYFDIGASFIVAFCMVETVYQFTVWLDRTDPWSTAFKKRFVKMLALCILLPVVIDFVGMGLYYYFRYKLEIWHSVRWFSLYMPVAVLLLALLNNYYYGKRSTLQNKELEKELDQQVAQTDEEKRLREEQQRLRAEETRQREEDIQKQRSIKARLEAAVHHVLPLLIRAVFYHYKNNKVWAILDDAEKIMTHYNTILQVEVSDEFMYANKGVIVKWTNIKKVIQVDQDFIIEVYFPEGIGSIKVSRSFSQKYRQRLKSMIVK